MPACGGGTGKLMVVKVPVRDPYVRTVQLSPCDGWNSPSKLKSSVPLRLALPVTAGWSNPLPGVFPPSSIVSKPSADWE